ncbi:unnamed protein product [Chrysoparadoxa australica]
MAEVAEEGTNPSIMPINEAEGQVDRYEHNLREVVEGFLPLGFLAFGGPSAHIALLHERFVDNKKWLSDDQFLELMAVGQGLPGPTSTQMVVATGCYHGGWMGGAIAFFCWNIPSFIVLTLAGLGVSAIATDANDDWAAGLGPAAVALVFIAAFKLGVKVCSGSTRLKYVLALISACVTLLINGDEDIDKAASAWVFPLMLVLGGLTTLADEKRRPGVYEKIQVKQDSSEVDTYKRVGIPVYAGAIIIISWITLLIIAVSVFPEDGLGGLFESFFRIGSIIYGGGQVVLPMLLDEVVAPGWVTKEEFLKGFALAQALPGPLFNFSAYLGAVYQGLPGALVGWVGLFGPGISLIFGFMPFWGRVRRVRWFKIFLQGVNATAIGLVVAACVLLWGGAVEVYADAIVVLVAGCMQAFLGIQAPFCIIGGGILGFLLSDTALSLAQAPYFPVSVA